MAASDEIAQLTREIAVEMGGDPSAAASLAGTIKMATSLSKVDEYNVRKAARRLPGRCADVDLFNRTLARLNDMRNCPVDCARFMYVLWHILDDGAVRDLVSLPRDSSPSSSLPTAPPGSLNSTMGTREKSPTVTSSMSTTIDTTSLLEGLPLSPPRKPVCITKSSTPLLSPKSLAALDAIGGRKEARKTDIPSVLRINFGDMIALRSQAGKYVAFDEDGEVRSSWPVAFPVCITNCTSWRDRGPLLFGDNVVLSLRSGAEAVYLSATSDGRIECSRSPNDSRSRWTVVNAESNPDSTSSVRSGDRVVLKSCFATLLSCDRSDTLHSSMSDVSAASTWSVQKASVPYSPSWLLEFRSARRVGKAPSFAKLPKERQERLLCRALLTALLGLESEWVGLSSSPNLGFKLSATQVCVTMQFQVERCFPVCNQYLEILHFVKLRSRYEYGLVSQALAGAMEAVLEMYVVKIAQLDSPDLSLQQLWFQLQPSIATISALHVLVSAAAGACGGSLIQVLYDLYCKEGDENSRAMYFQILKDCSEPYFVLLRKWIEFGIVQDPYDEFQIRVRDDITRDNLERDFNDSYWDERYVVRNEHVPAFLQQFSNKILLTGKYLNVLRQCSFGQAGRNSSQDADQSFGFDAALNGSIIDAAFGYASSALLDVLLQQNNLLPRLRCLKRYFLHGQGDFFVHFLDSAEEDLSRPVSAQRLARLQSLLELSLSTAGDDFGHDEISCRLEQHALLEKLNVIHNVANDAYSRTMHSSETLHRPTGSPLTGIEAFTLEYAVQWPISIVLSKKAMTKYELLFRHIFFIKHVERQIGITWRYQQRMRELDLSSTFSRSLVLRQRMMHFLQNLLFYLTVEVLEPNYHRLESALKQNVSTIDQVLEAHDAFLDTCLKECLLTNRNVLQSLTSLLSSCLLFAKHMNRFHAAFDAQRDSLDTNGDIDRLTGARRRERLAILSKQAMAAGQDAEYSNKIDEYLSGFDHKLNEFIGQLMERATGQYDSHMTNLCTRLDFNNYYRTKQNGSTTSRN
ncbi:hypothetical protein PBRA_006360 [Plasmodiophora brassicae]|nr:hypothetical protein PBRA_006360 [Plasmodiophora brassicae]